MVYPLVGRMIECCVVWMNTEAECWKRDCEQTLSHKALQNQVAAIPKYL